MEEDSRIELQELQADRDAAQNKFLMQFQADILDMSVLRPQIFDTTALGVAYFAGLGVGYWQDLQEVESNWSLDERYLPSMNSEERDKLYAG